MDHTCPMQKKVGGWGQSDSMKRLSKATPRLQRKTLKTFCDVEKNPLMDRKTFRGNNSFFKPTKNAKLTFQPKFSKILIDSRSNIESILKPRITALL